jgi:hypothetical protein
VDEERLASLFGSRKHPIYVYAPAYLAHSAGIRALHYLCHSLNQSGYLSWLVIYDWDSGRKQLLNPDLNAPILTSEIRDLHFSNGLAPIIIYPETIKGNPLGAQVVVRWVLNYPGILGGPKTFSDSEHVVSYSNEIAKTLEMRTHVLFLPTVDIREIQMIRNGLPNRSRTARALLYAGKYRAFVGSPVLPTWVTDKVTEIFREGRSRQSRNEVLTLLASSSRLYCFENSSLITESVLLKTPVILVRSPFFSSLIAENELGSDGTAWSDEEDPIAKSEMGIQNSENLYLQAISKFFLDLKREADVWQKIASESDYLSPISIPAPYIPTRLSSGRLSLAIHILRTQGLASLVKATVIFIKRLVLLARRDER